MKKYINNFMKYKSLLKELVLRDIKIRYRRSVLGVLWTLLNPLGMMVILTIVFSNIFKFDIEHFHIYVLSGQVIFNFFSEATTSAMDSVISSASLIKKVYIPKYIFPISRVFACVINILASFCALILVMLITRVQLHLAILLTFIPIVLLIILSIGVGLILSTVAVQFRDIIHFYSIFTTGLMYLTPIIYPLSVLPKGVETLVLLNPLSNILIMFRNFVMDNCMPTLYTTLMSVIPAFVFLILGIVIFKKKQDQFILYV